MDTSKRETTLEAKQISAPLAASMTRPWDEIATDMLSDWAKAHADLAYPENSTEAAQIGALVKAAPKLFAALRQWDIFMQTNFRPEEISFWEQTREAIRAAAGIDQPQAQQR